MNTKLPSPCNGPHPCLGLKGKFTQKAAFTIAFILISFNSLFSQVGISTTSITPNSSSILELRSTTLGFLPPRMTTTERDAISSPATGLVIYNTTTNLLNFYNGSSWQITATGSGTVSSVSVVSANGFAGTVATATTTPAITISTSITGILKGNGTAISAATAGTDYQVPITTGDVTTSGATATIANSAVTLAKMANMATSSLIYRKTAGTGAPEVNTLATLKTDLGLTGTNSGDQTITLTGDVTGSGTGSFATTIAADAITTTEILDGSVTYSKIQNVSATDKVLGRVTAGAGDVEEISTTGTGNVVRAISPTFTGTPTLPTGTVATTQSAGNNTTAIATTAFVAAAVPNASYRTILQAAGSHTAAKVAGTYALGNGDPIAVSGTGTLYPLSVIYIAAADYPTVNGAAAKLRIRAQLFTNDVAPTGNYTFGLYPITRPGTSGGTGLDIYTLGTVVSGSNGATFTTPAADGLLQAAGSDFALPADGFYVIGVVTTATVATNAHIHMNAQLQMRNN